ncbi:MAG: GNAT family N-acetyltransferase [Thermoanaerobaculia bacterium]
MIVSFRPASEADRSAIFELFSVAFGSPADPDTWAWKYDRNPNPAPSVVAVADGRIVAFYGSFGTRYRGAEGSYPGASAADVMTDPKARRLGREGLFKSLVFEWYRQCQEAGIPFGFGFPHQRALLIGVKTGDYRVVEPVTEWVKPLAPASPLSRLRRRFLKIVTGEAFGAPHDALAEVLHGREGWRTERSRAVLTWRYGERPGSPYRTWQLLDRRGRSRAYAVTRVVVDRVLLVDLQARDEQSGALADLLDAIADALRSEPVRTLELRAASRSVLAARAPELGFSARASDTTLVMRTFPPDAGFERASRGFDYRFGDHEIF